MGLGIKMAVESMDIPVVSHDHDYAWERGTRYESPFLEVQKLIDDTFPLRAAPQVRHAVINSAAKLELEQRFDIEAEVVPNVMDFDKPFGVPDEYNGDLLEQIGFDHEDIAIFQVTRVVERKGIDLAIDLIDQLDDPRDPGNQGQQGRRLGAERRDHGDAPGKEPPDHRPEQRRRRQVPVKFGRRAGRRASARRGNG